MLESIQQQATLLRDLHKELNDDSRVMECRMNELRMKLDDVTSSLVDVITDAANSHSNCILRASAVQ